MLRGAVGNHILKTTEVEHWKLRSCSRGIYIVHAVHRAIKTISKKKKCKKAKWLSEEILQVAEK